MLNVQNTHLPDMKIPEITMLAIIRGGVDRRQPTTVILRGYIWLKGNRVDSQYSQILYV